MKCDCYKTTTSQTFVTVKQRYCSTNNRCISYFRGFCNSTKNWMYFLVLNSTEKWLNQHSMTPWLCRIVTEAVNKLSKLFGEKIRAKHTDNPSHHRIFVSKHILSPDGPECLPWLVSDALFVVAPRCAALIVEDGHFTLVGGRRRRQWGKGRGRGFVVRMKSKGWSPFVSSFPRRPPLHLSVSISPNSCVLFLMSFLYWAWTCSHTV